MLLTAESVRYAEILETVQRAAAEEGFRDGRTGETPDEGEVIWVVHDTLNLFRALGLFIESGEWGKRTYGLTEIGAATALAALRSRATGSRTLPLRP